MNKAARRRHKRCRGLGDASCDDRIRAAALDGVLQIDVPVVAREGETREETRLQDNADRLRCRLLGLQVRVPAEQAVVLASRVGWRAGTDRKSGRDAAIVGRSDGLAGAGILRPIQLDRIRYEQLLDVRRANSPVVGSTQS